MAALSPRKPKKGPVGLSALSQRQFNTMSPRPPLPAGEPRLLEEEEKTELGDEVEDLRVELGALQVELDLLARAWRQRFNVDDSQVGPPATPLSPSLSPPPGPDPPQVQGDPR